LLFSGSDLLTVRSPAQNQSERIKNDGFTRTMSTKDWIESAYNMRRSYNKNKVRTSLISRRE